MSMERNLKEIIEELIQEVEHELDEATTTAGVDGYQTPFAFGNNRKKDKKKEKETATQAGYTIAEGKEEVTSKQLLKIQSDVQKINRKITAKISTHPATKGRLTISIPEDGNWEGDTEKVTKVVKKHTGDHRTGIIRYESVNEAKVKRPVNRWLELKNDDTMHPHKKMAHGLKELKYQLAETEKFFKWYNKIKNINELESSNYWKRTQSHIYKIKERLVNIARTIKEIEK